MLETLDYTIRIGSTPTFLYFDLYLYSAYAAHFVYFLGLVPYIWISYISSNVTLKWKPYHLRPSLEHCQSRGGKKFGQTNSKQTFWTLSE